MKSKLVGQGSRKLDKIEVDFNSQSLQAIDSAITRNSFGDLEKALSAKMESRSQYKLMATMRVY